MPDVVVAGAGPTGLMLANELALAGVEVVVLERLPARTGLSKALNLQPRTAEILDLRGLLGRAEDRAFTKVPEGHFSMIPLSYQSWATSHPYQLGIPQAELEEALEERLQEQGVQVHRGEELTDFTQSATEVTIKTTTRTIKAAYLVGCDGARSRVRRKLKIPFEGPEGKGHGVVADIQFKKRPTSAPKTWTSMSKVAAAHNNGNYSALIPLAEENTYRLSYGNRSRRPENMKDPVTEEEVRAALAARFDERTAAEATIKWASRYSDNARLAAKYRENRVFLAGDAAHIHFPAGGQGLNLGVQDAMNLGWKLAATTKHKAPKSLLATYETERRREAERVLQNVAAQTALIPASEEQKALRHLLRGLLEIPGVEHHLAGQISGLSITYKPKKEAHPLTGTRYPTKEIPNTLFHRGTHVALTTKQEIEPTERLTTAKLKELPWREIQGVLIRPDGYIAEATEKNLKIPDWLT